MSGAAGPVCSLIASGICTLTLAASCTPVNQAWANEKEAPPASQETATGKGSVEPNGSKRAAPFTGHALILQNVAGGQVRSLYDILKDQCNYPRANVIVLAEAKGLKDVADGPATKAKFFEVLDGLAERLTAREQLVVVFACHMQKGFLINDQISYKELDDHLARFRRGTRIAVVIEGCYSGAAIPVLQHADVVHAAGTADQPTWGGFLKFWVDAMGRNPDAVKTADADKDGRISLGEAYDYASDSERLTKLYRGLPKKVWPTTMVPTPMRRARLERMDYRMWLLPTSGAKHRNTSAQE